MEKQQPSLMESYYAEVERAYPKALKTLAEKAGYNGEVTEVILEATSTLGSRFELLCRVDETWVRVQIGGRTCNGLLFGGAGSRFDEESLYTTEFNANIRGEEKMFIEGDYVGIYPKEFMKMVKRPSGSWAVVDSEYINLEAAEKSWEMFPDLYPDCTTVKEVAQQIANDFVRRTKSQIVNMVRDTWGE